MNAILEIVVIRFRSEEKFFMKYAASVSGMNFVCRKHTSVQINKEQYTNKQSK